jgi:hypothetical protein
MNQQASMIEVREGENDNTDDANKDNIRAHNDHTTNIIDRKIHHIQSELIEKSSETSFEQSFIEAKLWFQPRHYVEVIDERSNEGMCGSPICCNSISKPQDLAVSLKISYKEKRLYEVGRSKLFCCNACFKNSAMFEATLIATHPGSRQVAIDFISKFDNDFKDRSSNLLPSIIGGETDDNRISEVDIPPPKFQNVLLDAAGATKIALKSVQFKEDIPHTVDAAKKVNKKDSPSLLLSSIKERSNEGIDVLSHVSDTSSLLSSSSSLPIFSYKKELPTVTEKKKPTITEEKKEREVTAVAEQNEIKKKVSVSSSKSLESSVEEKWIDIIPPVKSSSSGKNSSRYVCMNIHMCVCVFIYICICVFVYIYILLQMYSNINVYEYS